MILNFYVLEDPRSGDVRYVGKTQQRVNDRLYRHIAAARQGRSTDCARWIRGLLAEGLRPRARTLESRDYEPAQGSEREKIWVSRFIEAGCTLTNMTIGGFGSVGYHHSDKSKEKIREARARQVITAEHRAAISLGLRGNHNADGNTIWLGKKRGPMSQEQRAQISATMKRVRADHFWSTRHAS